MPRLSTTTAWPAVLCCAWLAAVPPSAAAAEDGARERQAMGFELSPVMLTPLHAQVEHPPAAFTPWPALTVRVHHLRYPSSYWTPGSLSFGWAPGDRGLLAALQTEFGWVHRGWGTLELGLGVGLGLFEVNVESTAFSCDGSCALGGGPLLLSPVARYLFVGRADRALLGVFMRAILPVTGDTVFGHPMGRAVGVFSGLDVGFGYFEPPAPVAEPPHTPLPTREWAGLELWFVTVNNGMPWDFVQPVAPQRSSFGPGADLRLYRFRNRFAYWTPMSLGLFWGALGASTRMAQARSEAGLVFQRRSAALEVGLSVGYGGLSVVYAEDRCSGDCIIGGRGLAVSPVLRLSFARPGERSMGGFLRYIKQNGDRRFFGESHGTAELYLAGLDLGFGR